mmetsp:Transcript_7115/g.10487  ORF Transcript_7115/g.10487 Transcript_7115/m.10487 type:complete len:564 (-) Transcript_7115:3693-5384(-)
MPIRKRTTTTTKQQHDDAHEINKLEPAKKKKRLTIDDKHIITHDDRSSITTQRKRGDIHLHMVSSVDKKARQVFEWMIYPCTIESFFKDYFDTKPLIIHRQDPDYVADIVSSQELMAAIDRYKLNYGTDYTLSQYIDGKRRTVQPKSNKLTTTEVLNFMNHDMTSNRFLCPQTFVQSIWEVLQALERFFGMNVGSNTYQTPAGSQGFAPHFDDVDVFIIQLEGVKHWKLYHPIDKDAHHLARVSSRNFNVSKDSLKAYRVETIDLKAGDMLYLPRGQIHEAKAHKALDSLHITISTGLQSTWFDFLDTALVEGLYEAKKKESSIRESLPRQFYNYMGSYAATMQPLTVEKESARLEFHQRFISHMHRIIDHMPIDRVTDMFAQSFFRERLPPPSHHQRKPLWGFKPDKALEHILKLQLTNDDRLEPLVARHQVYISCLPIPVAQRSPLQCLLDEKLQWPRGQLVDASYKDLFAEVDPEATYEYCLFYNTQNGRLYHTNESTFVILPHRELIPSMLALFEGPIDVSTWKAKAMQAVPSSFAATLPAQLDYLLKHACFVRLLQKK